MALTSCQNCGQQVSEQEHTEVCPQCGQRLSPRDARALDLGDFGWIMQVLGGLIATIGIGFVALVAPRFGATPAAATIWRLGWLFVVLGIVVCLLGRLGARWSRG